MRLLPFTFVLLAITQSAFGERVYWNQFRGPTGNGISTAKNLPVEFDEAKNVRWKIAIPEQGWSSPVVWGNEIWLTSGSDEKKELRAICVDLQSGKIVKDIKVFDKIERKVDAAYLHDSPHLNSPATPTSVVEEDRVFVHFGSQGIACLDRKTGDRIWERRDLRIYQPVRQGSSPIVDDECLYVAYDGTDQQFFVALDKETGDTRWKKDRNVNSEWNIGGGKPGDNKKSFATATLIEVNGQRQLIAPAAEATIAYAPDTGHELWRVHHPRGFNVAARPLHAHGMVYVFTSGLTGYLMGIRTNGSGNVTDTHIAWSTTRSTPRIPSPVIVGDLLFMVTDKGGIARCLNAKTGDEIWRKRIGGNHWASPLYAAGKLYFCSKEGDVAVLNASPEEPEIVAKNRLTARFIASPAVAGSSLILRSTTHLYCLRNGYERSEQEVAADVYPESKVAGRSPNKTPSKEERLEALEGRLKTLVKAGALTQAEAKAAYQKALASQGGKSAGKGKRRGKPGARPGSINFYAIVIGCLRSKDIELGEVEIDVDYVISDASRVKDEIVGKRVKLVGVSGQFLDNLLQIKRGETIKVRTGDYNPEKKELGFGYKFQVLERTSPFKPEDFGVPPQDFRGFRGELVGKVVEAVGYEVLLQVSEIKPADDNKAADANSIQGKRIRIAGFYNDHRDAFADLHEGDVLCVSTIHNDPGQDALRVTDVLEKVGK